MAEETIAGVGVFVADITSMRGLGSDACGHHVLRS